MQTPRISLSRSAAAAVERGHPWLLREHAPAAQTGAVVQLVDDRARPIGWGLADEGTIAVRVLGRGPVPDVGLADLVRERVHRADRVRVRLVPADTDAYRVVAGAGDGLPGLVVDRYGHLAVVRLYSAAWQAHLDAILDAILHLPWATTVLRRLGVGRVDGRTGTELLAGPPCADRLVVREAGIRVLVRPHAGQKTGLFLDQREHRGLVRRWASGRLVANLFAYTGGFSVAAALGGAARVHTVDISAEAIEDARENFRLNDLDPSHHAFEAADAFSWTPPGAVDLLVVDPPSLARTARSDSGARRAYRKLHARLGPLIPRDGLLASSSCTARLGLDAWRRAIEEALTGCGDWSWHWVSTEPTDHPTDLVHAEGRYLKFALLRRR